MSKYYLCMDNHVHAIYNTREKVNKSFDYYRKKIPLYKEISWTEMPYNTKDPEKVKYGGYKNIATLRAVTRLSEDEKAKKKASIYKSFRGFARHAKNIHKDFAYKTICDRTLDGIIESLPCSQRYNFKWRRNGRP